MTSNKAPDGWKEPLSRGLWAPDAPLGVAPRGLLLIHLPLGAAALFHTTQWAYVMAFVQFLLVALTHWDPEWFEILRGWLKESEEIEP